MPSVRCSFPPWVSPHLCPSSKPSATTTHSPSACRPLPTCLHGRRHAPLRSSDPHHTRHVNPAQHHPDLYSSGQPRQRRSTPLWPPSWPHSAQHPHGRFPPSLRDCNLGRFSPLPSLYTNRFVRPRASPIRVALPLFIKCNLILSLLMSSIVLVTSQQ